MAFSQITDMDVIAHPCAIRCVVIVAKHIQVRPLACGHLGHVGHQVIGNAARVFADEAITRLVYRFSMGKTEIDWARIQKGREEARSFLGARLVGDGLKSLFAKKDPPKPEQAASPKVDPVPEWLASYYRWMSSDRFQVETLYGRVKLFDDAGKRIENRKIAGSGSPEAAGPPARSAPGQNALPAPVTTITRAAGSSAACSRRVR